MRDKLIVSHLKESLELLKKFLEDEQILENIDKAGKLMVESIKSEGKILSCGNGGSMCDAMHFAEELTGRYRDDRPAIAAISLSDVSHMSCVSNDYGYDHVFARSVEALGRKGDILLAISTSGNSENVVKAVEAAKKREMHIIGLTGKNGGKLADMVDVEVRVPHHGYADRIQEIHIKVIHILIDYIESHL